jgi:hypothetical protein
MSQHAYAEFRVMQTAFTYTSIAFSQFALTKRALKAEMTLK